MASTVNGSREELGYTSIGTLGDISSDVSPDPAASLAHTSLPQQGNRVMDPTWSISSERLAVYNIPVSVVSRSAVRSSCNDNGLADSVVLGPRREHG